jgi:hypothetical protein
MSSYLRVSPIVAQGIAQINVTSFWGGVEGFALYKKS